jgi:hypothetical protein
MNRQECLKACDPDLDLDDRFPVILETAREVFSLARPFFRPDKDTGGVFILMWNSAENDDEYKGERQDFEADEHLVEVLGELDEERRLRCTAFAREKARRTLLNYDARCDVSSWESRQPDAGKYGGAIVTAEYVLSFSGLAENVDEALVNCVAVLCGLHTQDDADLIAAVSGNEFFPPLMESANAHFA